MVLEFVRVRGGRVSGNTIVIFLFSIYNYDFLVFFFTCVILHIILHHIHLHYMSRHKYSAI